MTEYSIVLSLLVLFLLIQCLITCKKIPLVASLLFLIIVLNYAMKYTDPTSYNSLIEEIGISDQENPFLFTFSFITLVACVCESLFLSITKLINTVKEKKTNGPDSTALKTFSKQSLSSSDDLDLIDSYLNLAKDQLVFIQTGKGFKTNLKTASFMSFEEFKALIVMDQFNETNQDENNLEGHPSMSHDIDLESLTYFQIKLDEKNIWVEKSEKIYQGVLLHIITNVDPSSLDKISVGDYHELEKKVNSLIDCKAHYSLLLVRLKNIVLLTNENKKIEVNEDALRTILKAKYLTSINQFLNEGRLKTYHVGEDEFAFLIENKQMIFFLKQKLIINPSSLSNFYYFLSNNTYVLYTKCVFQESTGELDVLKVLEPLTKKLSEIEMTNEDAYVLINQKTNETQKENKIENNLIKDISKDILI